MASRVHAARIENRALASSFCEKCEWGSRTTDSLARAQNKIVGPCASIALTLFKNDKPRTRPNGAEWRMANADEYDAMTTGEKTKTAAVMSKTMRPPLRRPLFRCDGTAIMF